MKKIIIALLSCMLFSVYSYADNQKVGLELFYLNCLSKTELSGIYAVRNNLGMAKKGIYIQGYEVLISGNASTSIMDDNCPLSGPVPCERGIRAINRFKALPCEQKVVEISTEIDVELSCLEGVLSKKARQLVGNKKTYQQMNTALVNGGHAKFNACSDYTEAEVR